MPVSKIAIGSPAEATQPDALKAALAEFISMLIFVFAGQGSGMAFSKSFLTSAECNVSIYHTLNKYNISIM